jgi:hypothetical protein
VVVHRDSVASIWIRTCSTIDQPGWTLIRRIAAMARATVAAAYRPDAGER